MCFADRNVKWCNHYVNSLVVPRKIKNRELPYDPAILLLSMQFKELKAGHPRDIHLHSSTVHHSQEVGATQMSIKDEWKKMWYILTVDYHVNSPIIHPYHSPTPYSGLSFTHTYSGLSFTPKEGNPVTCYSMAET